MKAVEFPGASDKYWRETEAGVRAALAGAGAPQAAIDWICGDLRPRYLALRASRQFDFGVIAPETAAAIEDLTAFFKERLLVALAEMVQLEIDLFYARFGGAPPKARFQLAA